MTPQTRESLVTGLVYAVIGAPLIAGFLITKTTALDGLVRVAGWVVFGDAS